MENPYISVLMVNYNQEDLIAQSIECVLNQSYKNIQFIIVDDGSTDSSGDIIRKYAESDSRIEFYPMKKNMHISYATNYGFSKVKGEYLARIDSDDLWVFDKLEKQLAYMKKNPACQICFTGTDLIDEKGNLINDMENVYFLYRLLNQPNMSQEEILRYFFAEGNRFTHSSVLMKSAVMQETGGFHLAYRQLHDFDYWVRIAKHYPLFFLEDHLTKLRRFIHTEKENTSSQSETDTIRFYNEYMMIRESFFDDITPSLFCSAFGGLFRKKNAASPEELECEKAFLLLDGFSINGKKQPVLGLRRLARLLENKKTADVLIHTYHYTPIEYYRENGNPLFYDPFTQDAVSNIKKVLDDNLVLLADNQKLLADNNILADSNHILTEENQNLLNENQRLETEYTKLSQKNAALSAESEKLLKNLKQAEASLDIIINSTCWKMTSPVRKVLDKLKH